MQLAMQLHSLALAFGFFFLAPNNPFFFDSLDARFSDREIEGSGC
jgi:hypothetical protein